MPPKRQAKPTLGSFFELVQSDDTVVDGVAKIRAHCKETPNIGNESTETWKTLIENLISSNKRESLALVIDILQGKCQGCEVKWARSEIEFSTKLLDKLCTAPDVQDSDLYEKRADLTVVLLQILDSGDVLPVLKMWDLMFGNFGKYLIAIGKGYVQYLQNSDPMRINFGLDWLSRFKNFLDLNKENPECSDVNTVEMLIQLTKITFFDFQVYVETNQVQELEIGAKIGAILSLCLSLPLEISDDITGQRMTLFGAVVKYILEDILIPMADVYSRFTEYANREFMTSLFLTCKRSPVQDQCEGIASSLACVCDETVLNRLLKSYLFTKVAVYDSMVLIQHSGELISMVKRHPQLQAMGGVFHALLKKPNLLGNDLIWGLARLLDFLTASDPALFEFGLKNLTLVVHLNYVDIKKTHLSCIEKHLSNTNLKVRLALRRLLIKLAYENVNVFRGCGGNYYKGIDLNDPDSTQEVKLINHLLSLIAVVDDEEAERVVQIMESYINIVIPQMVTVNILKRWRSIAIAHPSVMQRRNRILERMSREPTTRAQSLEIISILSRPNRIARSTSRCRAT